MEENEDEKTYNIKINIYGEDIDLTINSDYNLFCKDICIILKISSQDLKEIILSYYDEDGDHIKLSSSDDYEIFFDQVKDKTVTKLNIEINENSKINAIKCLSDALIYQENHSKEYLDDENDNNINNNIIINKDNNNDNNNIIKIKNDKNNNNNDNKDIIIHKDNDYEINNKENEKIIKKIDNKNNDNYIINNYNDNQIENEKKPINNNNEKIDDLVYYYRCSLCDIYPIICIMYYCQKCVLYFCENCQQFLNDHKHPLIKIESKKQLDEIKQKENDNIEEKNKKNNENLNENDNENHLENENEKKGIFDSILDFFGYKPFKDYKNKKQIINDKNKEPGNAGKDLGKQMKYLKIIHKERENYDLAGVSDEDLINCLDLTNGDFNKAILLLYK